MRRKSLPRRVMSDAFRALGLAYFDMCLGETRLDEMPPLEAHGSAEVRRAECRELLSLAELDELSSPQRLERNLDLGSSAYVAEIDDRIVGYAWLNDRVIELLGEEIQVLPSGWMLVHHCFVDAEYRNQGILQTMLMKLYRSSLAAGRSTAACLVDRANQPALAAFRRLGADFRSAPIVKMPGLRMRFLKPGSVPRLS